MWAWLASRILRNRVAVLVAVGLLTVWSAWEATHIGMEYKHGGLLPKTDSAYVEYSRFLTDFSEDGNVLVIGTGTFAIGFFADVFEAQAFAVPLTTALLGSDVIAILAALIYFNLHRSSRRPQ